MPGEAAAGPSQLASVSPQWRQFTFFDLEPVTESEEDKQPPAFIRDARPPLVITSSAGTGSDPSLIISSSADITIVDRNFRPLRSWRAWDGNGRATALLESGGLLVGIGEDDTSRYPVLKVWDLTRDEKKRAGGGPVLVRNVRIQHGQRPHPVSSIALTSNLSHLAIGLGDGTVLLYRHLLQSLTTSPTALTSLPKARVIHESSEPITGLGFREALSPSTRAPDSDKPNSTTISLFIVTTNRVLSALVSGRGGEARTIDELGCGLGCAAMDSERKDMIIVRDEAIYLYSPEGRGACYAYEGPKSSISVFKHNLIITSPPFFPSAGSNSSTVRHYVAKNDGGSSDIAKITIFDLQNKLIAYSGTFRDGVREVFHQWGEIFVLGSNGKLSRLDEHSTKAKLDVLYRRHLYSLAASLAQSQGYSDAGIAEIHRKYGDYLYTKGDFDGAMAQFVQTLGHLQPSYVIRKFLDAQRIHHLTTYLQELHSRGLASPDHTTLLLNCYTKTGDRTRLETFIKAEVGKSGEKDNVDELPFDLDTAIRVCRQAGFYDHAAYLAKRWNRHEDYLRIQIEDAEQFDDALPYLRSLGPEAVSDPYLLQLLTPKCEENLLLYGRMLLQFRPEATTGLLIDLCSGQLGKKSALVSVSPTKESKASANGTSAPAVLSYLGVNKVTGLFTGGEANQTTEAKTQPNPGDQQALGAKDAEKEGEANKVEDEPSYIPPSPRLYFAHFVDHQDLFVKFLESVAAILWDQVITPPDLNRSTPLAPRDAELPDSGDETVIDQRAVWNTLLELYLASSKSPETDVARTARDKAISLLADTGKPYDPVHAMILCSTAGFTEGLVGLWESMGMYEDVLRFWMDKPEPMENGNGGEPGGRHPSDEVLRCLDLYGPSHHHLYPLVLRYLTSSPTILSRHSSELPRLLATVDEERILPPLAVVQLISRNDVASVGQVKDWLRLKVEETRQDVDSDRQLIQSYRTETKDREKELVALADPKVPETFQVTRCAACQQQLDLPAVHFMCKHSYHQRCLSDSDPECILCARQHSIIREVRRGQTRMADRHDLFLNEVHDADDGFAIVAGAFGRGLLDQQVIAEA